MRQAVATFLLLAGATEGQQHIATRDSTCKDVHVFLARGNNEPYPGRQGKLITAICSGLSSCDYEDIKFYNPLESVYCDSVFEGARNGIDQITAYNKKCPDSKLVVSGYSQGAQVVGDVLGGGGGTFFQGCVQGSNEGLDPESRPGNKIVAAMVFGDTRHTADQPYNVLTGVGKDGLFPRTSEMLTNLAKYGDALHSYCVETDPICAQGDVVETHLNYFDVYGDTAAEWVHERVKAAGVDSTSISSSTSVSKKKTKTKEVTSTTATEEASTTESGSETETESSTKTMTKTKSTATTASSTQDASSDTTASVTSSESASGSGSESSATETASSAEATTSANNAGSRDSQLGAVLFALGAILAF